MNKYLLLISIFLFYSTGFSQKPTQFYNEKNIEISKAKFNKQNDASKNLGIRIENDSVVKMQLVKRKNYGKLDKATFTAFKNNLFAEGNMQKDFAVIIYYPGKDPCNEEKSMSRASIFYDEYLNGLKNIASYTHFWLYKNDENLQYYHPKKVDWQKDKNHLVENLFFKYHYPCMSFVIVSKSGAYASYFGEFADATVWELLSEFKRKKS